MPPRGSAPGRGEPARSRSIRRAALGEVRGIEVAGRERLVGDVAVAVGERELQRLRLEVDPVGGVAPQRAARRARAPAAPPRPARSAAARAPRRRGGRGAAARPTRPRGRRGRRARASSPRRSHRASAPSYSAAGPSEASIRRLWPSSGRRAICPTCGALPKTRRASSSLKPGAIAAHAAGDHRSDGEAAARRRRSQARGSGRGPRCRSARAGRPIPRPLPGR